MRHAREWQRMTCVSSRVNHRCLRRKRSSSVLPTAKSIFEILTLIYLLFDPHNYCVTRVDAAIFTKVEKWPDIEVPDGHVVVRRRDPPTFPPSTENPCGCHRHDEDHVQENKGANPDDPESYGARLAYLVTVHSNRTMEDAVYLFRAIRAPRTIIIIHIDIKLEWDFFLQSNLHAEIENCPCEADVYVDSIYDCKWGTWSMNAPTHWGMDVLINHPKYHNQWDIFINLSGDTMPIYTPHRMAQLFDPHDGPLRNMNFVTSSSCATGLLPTNVLLFPRGWHKREHYLHAFPDSGGPSIRYLDDDGVGKEITLVTHFGSQWMALQYDFVQYLVSSLKRKDSLPSLYKDALVKAGVLMTDETFVPTLLVHVYPFNRTLPLVDEDGSLETLPSMTSIRYERMDEHYPDAFGYFPIHQRYEVPESSLAEEPKIWGPYFLGVYDLANIKYSGALFVRKISVFVDPNIVHMLPVSDINDLPSIQWPAEVKLSEVPNWPKMKAEFIRKAIEREERKRKRAKDKHKEEDVAIDKQEGSEEDEVEDSIVEGPSHPHE